MIMPTSKDMDLWLDYEREALWYYREMEGVPKLGTSTGNAKKIENDRIENLRRTVEKALNDRELTTYPVIKRKKEKFKEVDLKPKRKIDL